MQRSPRIADIGIAAAPAGNKANALGAGAEPGVNLGKAGGDGLGYYGTSMAEAAGTTAGVGNGEDPVGNGMRRELWQETDTMYDNLPFDPAYRTFLRSFINALVLILLAISVRLGSSQPRIRHALLNVCRFRDRYDSNAAFILYGPAAFHA